MTYLPLWPWLVHRFGVAGALVSYVVMLSWIVTPVLLALLYRKSLALNAISLTSLTASVPTEATASRASEARW